MLEGLGTQNEREGLLDKIRNPECNVGYIQEWSNLTKMFVQAFPYSLTPSQLKAVSEILWDLQQPAPMNRLLQVWNFRLMDFFLIELITVYIHAQIYCYRFHMS